MGDAEIGLRTETRDAGAVVAFVTIDNTSRLNCLNTGLMAEFARTMTGLSEDPLLRAVVLSGAGDKAFVAGGGSGD